MRATRFAINSPKGAAALAAELRADQHRNAHQRLDQGLRRWPAVALAKPGPQPMRATCQPLCQNTSTELARNSRRPSRRGERRDAAELGSWSVVDDSAVDQLLGHTMRR